ncbi:hypothetical protein MP638_005500 [Amoeboaphelidium occidentale]|nr:hypothetical protein MP638_005500 [Amoeboaphelidium occidentale]
MKLLTFSWLFVYAAVFAGSTVAQDQLAWQIDANADQISPADGTNESDLNNPVLDFLFKQTLKRSMQLLVSSISGSQVNKSTDYTPRYTYPPLISWQRQAGLYDSFVHLNFHGDLPVSALLRNGYKFPDDNAFVTMFVVHALVDSMQLNKNLKVSEHELQAAVHAISTHRDKNKKDVGPLYSFWNQIPVFDLNGTLHFKATPKNIEYPLSDLKTGAVLIKKFADFLRLGDISKFLKGVVSFDDAFRAAFRIPADADDTGANLALGMQLLASNRTETNKAEYLWFLGNSFQFNETLKQFVKYSYKPFSPDTYQSLVDPRTYLWIHEFLEEEAKNRGFEVETLVDDNFGLITTWLQSASEVNEQYDYARMPFNVNNVDLSVTANALYGITSIYKMSHLVTVTSFEEYKEFYEANVRLLCWALKERIVERYNTQALLYYPPKFAFYWFVSRIISLLATELEGPTPEYAHKMDPVFVEVGKNALVMLREAMDQYGVPEILKNVQCDEKMTVCHWDDFLGNAERFKNKSYVLPEDRVFSTSMAVNAIIDTYIERRTTTSQTVQKLKMLNNDEKVANVLEASIRWLTVNAWAFPKENAFFSASVKNGDSNTFNYPSNFAQFLNGTQVDCHQMKGNWDNDVNRLIVAMKGAINHNSYEKLLHEPVCFNKTFPEKRVGQSLNCDDCVFPYWSSPALTDSVRLLALSKYWNLKYEN